MFLYTCRNSRQTCQGERKTERKPLWLKAKLPSHHNFFFVSQLVKAHRLSTICQSAKCPNISECWSEKTATFLILGETCTRACAFCAVNKGLPAPPDRDEPWRVAEAVLSLGLRYAVITSVTRDDLPDGGAQHFADTITAVKQQAPGVRIEVLIPDFNGSEDALERVIQAEPDIINHNLETVGPLYPRINRPQENYRSSLRVLERAKKRGAVTKSGLMVGLGEDDSGILKTLSDLESVSCDLLTIGQYLQPTSRSTPVAKYYPLQEFSRLKSIALEFGFQEVEAGPLVRSSFRAHSMYQTLQREKDERRCDT